MIVENITISQAELNTTSGIIKDIAELSIPNVDNFNENYLPRTLIMNNNTGDIVNYTALTQAEYTKYEETSGAITQLIPIYQEQSDAISNLKGNLKKLVVQGNGAHTSGLIISVVKTS
jgi:hypothetical protein